MCRAFASWKEFMILGQEKRAKVQKASKACFASSLQRAWTKWQAAVHRNKLLRRALESRQVSLPLPLPLEAKSKEKPMPLGGVMGASMLRSILGLLSWTMCCCIHAAAVLLQPGSSSLALAMSCDETPKI